MRGTARTIYLDNAASTRALPEVAEAVSRALLSEYANPASLHVLGLAAERLVASARERLAKALGVHPDEIVFTSGGTEANNLALKGSARARAGRGRRILLAAIEHDSVLKAAGALAAEGFAVDHLPVDRCGRVAPDEVLAAIRPDTTVVSIGIVNNETGTIQPIAEIARSLASLGQDRPLLHTDAVQALGKVPLGEIMARVDLASFSAHKVHGPKGAGALWVRRGTRLVPMADGGGQERGLRPGTENVPGIAGFAAALDHLAEVEALWPEMRRLKTRFLEQVRGGLGDIAEVPVNGPPPEEAAPHLLNVSVPGLRGEVLVHALEEQGVLVSTGSACTSRDPEPSHVLAAMGLPADRAAGAVRLSLSRFTTEEEIDLAAQAFVAAAAHLLRFARRARARH